jgi:hypothetical protein
MTGWRRGKIENPYISYNQAVVQRVPSAAKMLAKADWRPAATVRPDLPAHDRVTNSLDRVVDGLSRVAS